MCGIVGGMSSTLVGAEITKIKGLMILSCFRGMYGSGSMVVVPEKKMLRVVTHKTELCAAELMCEDEFTSVINKSPKIIVTHARAPTKGSNDLAFVHPHRTKHITGVHNGTMHRVMDKTIGGDESDSSACFAAIAEHGVEEFVKESRGAYSLVWLDVTKGTLNFLRNEQRPMVMASIGFNDRVSTMYFASELSQLHYVLKRDGVKLDEVKFEQPKAYQHVSFPMDVKHTIVPTEIKQYEDPLVSKAWAGYTGMSQDEWDAYDDSQNVIPWKPGAEERKATFQETFFQKRTSVPQIARQATRPQFLPRVEEILSRRNAPSRTFRPEFTPTNDIKAKNLLKSGPCCVCDDTPSVINVNGTQVYPKIHEVKFGTGYPQYICDDCVTGGNPIALSILEPASASSSTRH